MFHSRLYLEDLDLYLLVCVMQLIRSRTFWIAVLAYSNFSLVLDYIRRFWNLDLCINRPRFQVGYLSVILILVEDTSYHCAV